MEQKEPEIKQIGLKIKQLRELRNLTQEHMANRLDLSLNGYGKIEREETELTLNRLSQIADILEVKVFDLLGFDASKVFFNQTSNDSSKGANIILEQKDMTNDERKQYEARISDLKQENERLHALLEKALTK